MKKDKVAIIYLLKDGRNAGLDAEQSYVRKLFATDKKGILVNFALPEYHTYLIVPTQSKDESKIDYLNSLRELARKWVEQARNSEQYNWILEDVEWHNKEEINALVEGFMLSSYSFDKFKTKKNKVLTLSKVNSEIFTQEDFEAAKAISEEVNWVKDLIELPYSALNATEFAKAMYTHVSSLGVVSKIWTRKEIEKAYMGGLLGVNKGSEDEPSFTEMVYKPETAKNKKPVLLVGKGVVFDAGGMNIKTDSYMDDMKTDMSGGAMAAGIISLIARFKLPLYVVALVPATDNRLNNNALVPGDVIRMGGETSVEIVNTDAEGRLLLADAVFYGQKQYNPDCIISMATLTGAASRAMGTKAVVAMEENFSDKMKEALAAASVQSQEKYWFFPMWKEYDKELESSIADIKNCGSGSAGMISAAKFVAYFAKAPFLHLDVAGVAYMDKAEGAWHKGATGMGVRWMLAFLNNYTKQIR